MTKACKNCVFWVPTGGNTNGQCRRFPPTERYIVNTFADFWCGEHKPVPVEKKKRNA